MKKRLLAAVLCVMMVLTLLPVTVLAADAAVRYLDITLFNNNPTACEYKDTADGTEGILISDGTYTLESNYEGIIVIDNAAVTYGVSLDFSTIGDTVFIFGSGSLITTDVIVRAGSYTTSYDGDNGTALLSAVGAVKAASALYTYDFTNSYNLNVNLDAYGATVASDKTLTLQGNSCLKISHSLTVTGTLTGEEGSTLEIGENAAASGVSLYDTDSTNYTLASSHNAEAFTFTGNKWVRQGGGDGGDNPPLTAPTVSFCVQNTDPATGTVQYKINDGGWKDLLLSLEGESPNQHLAGTISDSLATNDVIHIKAALSAGYEMDTTRGVKVWSDGTDSTVDNGTSSIVSTDGLSYTLSENKAYEFEFGFQPTGGGGDSGTTYTIIASVVGGNGSITPSGTQSVNEGQNRQFTFQPDAGYEVDEVLVDEQPVSAAPEYEFQNVNGNHTISVSFKQITGASGDAATAKAKIEGRRWGYGGADAEAIKAAFAAELWDMAVHEFSGVFANKDAVTGAVTLSDETATVSSEFYQAAETLCPYYSFTVELGENDASGKVYVLTSTTAYVVVTNGGSTPANFTIVSGQEATVNKDYDTLGVFGNGAAIEGQLGSGENYAAFHVATRAGLGADTFRLTVYKTSFVGSTVTVSDSYKAAAWGFAQAKIAEFGSSAAAPSEFEVYFGNSSVTLSASGLSDVGIQALVNVTSALPDGAVSISSDNGSFTVAFNSNFYDEVPLTITYTNKAGGTDTAYLTLKRVGIDIQAYQKTGDSNGSYNTNHGTDPGLQNQSWGDDSYAVYASYYYPTGNTPEYSVDLYATYTWTNGSVTREIVARTAHADGDDNSVPIDDFLLYKGAESGAPAKIEVTAVKTGGSEDAFAGAALGSGAGVAWVYTAHDN